MVPRSQIGNVPDSVIYGNVAPLPSFETHRRNGRDRNQNLVPPGRLDQWGRDVRSTAGVVTDEGFVTRRFRASRFFHPSACYIYADGLVLRQRVTVYIFDVKPRPSEVRYSLKPLGYAGVWAAL